jgi:hypothetical protein
VFSPPKRRPDTFPASAVSSWYIPARRDRRRTRATGSCECWLARLARSLPVTIGKLANLARRGDGPTAAMPPASTVSKAPPLARPPGSTFRWSRALPMGWTSPSRKTRRASGLSEHVSMKLKAFNDTVGYTTDEPR